MKKIAALALAASLALPVATGAFAQEDAGMISMGQSMLTGALYNSLRAGGHPTEGIEKLTLGEVALLKSLLETDMSTTERSGQIKLIFDRAATR